MPSPRRSRSYAIALALVTSLTLAGCMEGERGYFADEPFGTGTFTGDEAIDAVLTLLDAAPDGPTASPVTVGYTVLTKLGVTNHTATVALDANKRSIVINNVHYFDVDGITATCASDGSAPCTDGLDLARISDVGITPDFYAADTAKRLRRDAIAKVGPSIASVQNIAGMAATCVDLPLPGGTARYCAVASGMLALLDDGDVRIEMTGLMELVDPATFVQSGT